MSLPLDKDQMVVAVIKGLVMDGVAAANSGHPGGAMSSADYAAILFKDYLRVSPGDPAWFNRDRFVLSAGHESMLLYSLLHLQGLLSTQDLKAFRQLGSRTPGHPEHHLTPGVEATTGPLGQGLAMAVGMAVAETIKRARLGSEVCDHYVYALASDGDFQESVVFGAAALAGLWGLNKLIVFYDSNQVQLAGPTSRADATDYPAVFAGLGWQVINIDGHDHAQIHKALDTARAETARPTLIIGRTVIAKGTACMEGDSCTHGAPLPPEEIAATKKLLGLPEDQTFYSPQEALEHFQARFPALGQEATAWKKALTARQAKDPAFARTYSEMNAPRHTLNVGRPAFTPGEKVATRVAWGKCLGQVMDALPGLVGGSADLDPSNQTEKFREAQGNFSADNRLGRNLAFGVREFPMATILNGMALSGGLIPFGATFLTFSDYCRNAIRMSALQELPVLYVFTHDSFHLGEDGPTHQPIEHVASLRLIPNLLVLRPADANETAACLAIALTQDTRPSCLILTRQGLPVLDPAEHPNLVGGPEKGGYILSDCEGTPELIFIAAGSEVALAKAAMKLLPGRKMRLVSMPSVELFEAQPKEYKEAVLPPSVRARVAIEAGRPEGWYAYAGLDGLVIGLTHFGESAPAGLLAKKYGFTPEAVAKAVQEKF